MHLLRVLPCLATLALPILRASETTAAATPANAKPVAGAINQLGVDLLRSLPADAAPSNALLSPYSISSALALAQVGADGTTRDELRRGLHLPADDAAALAGFAALDGALRALVATSERRAAEATARGYSQETIALTVANRVYAQQGLKLLPDYLATIRTTFRSDLVALDFRGAAEPARRSINDWVATETRDKIRDLIPPRGVDATTRAVLVNALHLRAPWQEPFLPRWTKPEPFRVGGTDTHPIPTMMQTDSFGFAERPGYTAIGLPYVGGELQFLILLPDDARGLARLVRSDLAATIVANAKLPRRKIELHLPKFRIAGDTLPLGGMLVRLGMPTVFDQPRGSANFARMAARTPTDYLTFSEVFHKTFLELDEKGTEAAAATAVAMVAGAAPGKPTPPPIVRVDRPFLFAVQHVDSGACLFLGWVNDPR